MSIAKLPVHARIILFVGIGWLVCQGVKAQIGQPNQVKSGFTLQAGVNYSLTTIHQPPPGRLIGLDNKVGYYVEGAYFRQCQSGLVLQLSTGFQQKGISATNPFGLAPLNASYYYISLTPCIGFEPIPHVYLLAGPQMSRLVGMQNILGKAETIEFGLVVRASYQVSKVHVNLGYFGGLGPYDRIDPIKASLYNQCWSVGLSRYIR